MGVNIGFFLLKVEENKEKRDTKSLLKCKINL